jgi:hypothetical protein
VPFNSGPFKSTRRTRDPTTTISSTLHLSTVPTLDNSVQVIEFTLIILIIVFFFAGPNPTLLIWFNIRKYTINEDTYQKFIL